MYPISPLYAEYLKRHDREFIVKALINGVEYDNTVIVDFTVNNQIVSSDEFEIGTVIPSQLTITMRTRDVIPANAKIIPFLSLSLAGMTWDEADYPWEDMDLPWEGGATEWLPLGEFYVDSREKVYDTWVFTCMDKLIWSDVAFVSALSYPATQQAVWGEICSQLGYSYAGVVIDPSYTFQVAPTGFTSKQVMGFIASANSASVYADKDGVIRFRRYTTAGSPSFEVVLSDYIRAKQVNPVKTYTRVVVTYETDDGLTYEAGTGDDNHTLYLTNPYATQAMVDKLLLSLNGFTYMPISMDARGFPQLDAGDTVRFEQSESPAWMEADIAWEDADIPWDGIYRYKTVILKQVLSFKGGLKLQIEAPSLSDQQSEIVVDGSLTTAVANLNQISVKLGKPYYGVTHSKAHGIQIGRSDGKSDLTLNSDIMDWRVDGESQLYYDALANRIKFTGTLEGADGVFSGNLSAVGGTFTGTLVGVDGEFSGSLQAATGTFAGDLQAAGGTFTGDLQAAGGTFSGNLSAAGGTFTGELVAASGTFSGDLSAAGGTFRGALQAASGSFTGELIAASGTFKGTLEGGSIISNTTINVTTDAVVGRNLYLNGVGSKGISFGFGGSVTSYNDVSLSIQAGQILEIIGTKIFMMGEVNFAAASVTNFSIGMVDGLYSYLSYLDARISALGG